MNRIILGLLVFVFVTSARAADLTIDQLSAASALAGTESVPIFQTANPAVKTTATAIANTASLLAVGTGSAGAPTITGVGDTTTGIYFSGNNVRISSGSSNTFQFTAAGGPNLRMQSGGGLAWSSSPSDPGSSDTYITRGVGANIIRIGNVDSSSPAAQTLTVESGFGSNIAGANWTIKGSQSTGSGANGNIIMQLGLDGGGGGSSLNTSYPLLTLNHGTATTASVQFGDGTNYTKYDSCTALTTGSTGVITCTASAMRFKNPLGSMTLASLSPLHPAVWTYKDPQQFGEGEFVGLYADDVAKMDSRCVTYDHGKLKDYRDRCVIAHLVAVVQQQQEQIDELRRKLP